MGEWLLQLTFIERGLLAAILIGIICPVLGTFLVVRRIAIISESLSHITLTGISAAILMSQTFILFGDVNPMYMGVLFSLFGALLIEKLRQVYRHFEELAVPIILSTGIGLSAIFMSIAKSGYNVWFAYLFGSIVSVTLADLMFMFFTSVLVLLLIAIFYKEFVAVSFDQEYSKVSGLPVKKLNFIFSILVALVIAISMKVVGILLVGAMVVLPAAAALKVAKSFRQLLLSSIAFGQISIFSGIYFSYHLNVATGGGIVVAASLLLIFVHFSVNFFKRGGRVK